MAIIDHDLRVCDVEHPSLAKGVAYFFTHPDFRVVVIYRWVLALYGKGGLGKVLAKYLWARLVKNGGCYLSPKAVVGHGFRMPHPVGVVIGDGVVIGNHVTIYQHVTLGQKNDCYPAIGDGVTIYPGACLFGAITIERGAIIGANAVVTKNVPENAVVAGVPAKVIKTRV